MRWLAALLWLLFAVPAGAQTLQNFSTGAGVAAPTCSDSQPAPAAANSFNTETFCMDSAGATGPAFSASNVDLSNTFTSGFRWYGQSASEHLANVSFSSGAAVIGCNAGCQSNDYNMSSASVVNTTTGAMVGTAFGGGMYYQFTAKFAFSSSSDLSTGYPGGWINPIGTYPNINGYPELQWPGQTAGYVNYTEIDLLEYKQSSLTVYTGGPGNWWGTLSCGGSFYCSLFAARNNTTISDFTITHTYGVLITPAVNGGAQGSIKIYFDGSLKQTFSYDYYTGTGGQTPPPALNNGWIFGSTDLMHYILIFGSNNTNKITISNVQVWQVDGSKNIHG